MRHPVILKKFFLITALLLAMNQFLQAKTISGVIKNLKFKTLDIVKIKVRETGKHYYSDQNGVFSITVPEGFRSVILEISNNFYYPKTLKVSTPGPLTRIEILLVPKEHLKEEITITALSQEEKSVSVPVAQSSVSNLEIREKISENIVSTLESTPGVHFIGSGGFSATPSIRGLARRRVLMLIDGVRITSDRRAGSSGSFIAPELINKIEVVRSSSSVLYGSDAIGGVVQLMVDQDPGKDDTRNSINLSTATINNWLSAGLTYNLTAGKFFFSSGFQYSAGQNYSSPEYEVLHSDFKNYSLYFAMSYKASNRDFSLSYLGGMGQDIGKPDRENNPDKYTIVPDDINHIINFNYHERTLFKNCQLNFQLYLNPGKYSLSKFDNTEDKQESSQTDTFNFGFRLNLSKKISDPLSVKFGIDYYGRRNVNISNEVSTASFRESNLPLQNGTRSDTGVFLTGDFSGLKGFDIMAGVRFTFFQSGAEIDQEEFSSSYQAPAFFLGITKNFGSNLALFINLGTAFRSPSLSEAYYTGLTGRRYVVGNPYLKPEKSFNFDTGLKYFSPNLFLGLYFFWQDISNMIERYRSPEDIYTYDNINRGSIYGTEFEFQFFFLKNGEIFGHFYYFKGKNAADNSSLNDIPAAKVLVGSKYMFGKLWLEISYSHSFLKQDVGPSEIENESFDLLNLKGGYYFSSNLFLYLKVTNLFNEVYYANPDPDIPQAKALNLSAGISITF